MKVKESITFLSTVDDEHLSRGQNDHVTHAPGVRHSLHRPSSVRIPNRHSTTSLRTCKIRPRSLECPKLSTPTDKDFRDTIILRSHQWKHDRRSSGRVVAGLARDGRERLDHRVGDVVIDDGVSVSEDVESAIRKQVNIRIQVVCLCILRRL